MLEIRYNRETKKVTAWCGNPERFGKIDRGRIEEAIVVLDIPIPDKPPMAWLFAGDKLIPNPDYVEPELPRDPLIEIDELRAGQHEIKERLNLLLKKP